MHSFNLELSEELKNIEAYIQSNLSSRNSLLTETVEGLLEAGGKRLRPVFLVLSSRFGKHDRKKATVAAAAVEVLHMATLVHDDVIDRSNLRRGMETVYSKYGSDMAVYTGDFLFTKAVLMLSKTLPAKYLDTIAKVIKSICEGEVDQFQDRFNLNTTTYAYLKRIGRKTAAMFSTSCSLGAYLAKCPPKTIRSLTKFGFYYGMAFQLRDDLNDFISNEEHSGKPVGKDIMEGVITLPLICAMQKNPEVRSILEKYISGKASTDECNETMIVEAVKANQGIEKTRQLLDIYTQKGLKILEMLPQNQSNLKFQELLKNLRPSED